MCVSAHRAPTQRGGYAAFMHYAAAAADCDIVAAAQVLTRTWKILQYLISSTFTTLTP